MVRVVHKLLKASVLCESQRDALLVLRALQNIVRDEPAFVETICAPCLTPDNPAPATFCGHGVNQGYPCLECQAAGIAAPAGTTKEE